MQIGTDAASVDRFKSHTILQNVWLCMADIFLCKNHTTLQQTDERETFFLSYFTDFAMYKNRYALHIQQPPQQQHQQPNHV